MPKPYPKEFRDDVVAVARKGQAPVTQIAKDTALDDLTLAPGPTDRGPSTLRGRQRRRDGGSRT